MSIIIDRIWFATLARNLTGLYGDMKNNNSVKIHVTVLISPIFLYSCVIRTKR